MIKVPVEPGSMVMMKLLPEAEKNHGALDRTFELPDDCYYETDQEYSLKTNRPNAFTCIPKEGDKLRVAFARNLSSLKTGELVWSDGESFDMMDNENNELIENMSHIFLTPVGEIETGKGDIDADPVILNPEMLDPGLQGFILRMAGLFEVDPNSTAAMNDIGFNVITTYTKFYSLMKYLYTERHDILTPLEKGWLTEQMEAFQRRGIINLARHVDGSLTFPYSDMEIVKLLFKDDRNFGEQLST